MTTKEKNKICILCRKAIDDFGHNATPVAEGLGTFPGAAVNGEYSRLKATDCGKYYGPKDWHEPMTKQPLRRVL
jgi:hypothetical protein